LNLWLRIFLPFAAGYYFSYFLRNVNAVIAPELTRELGVSAADLGLLTSAYLLAFGAVQLPLGLALDRYGARRVEASLLLIAAAGCALFAVGNSLTELAVARALIGLGVSACLMASFKAFGQWFGTERQASLNAAIMAAGGLGALTASTPLSWAIPQFGWRAVFIVPGHRRPRRRRGDLQHAGQAGRQYAPEPLSGQVAGLVEVLASRAFWRYAPQSTLIIGGFLALQGLWAVPWLMNFSGLSREAAAHHLLLMGGGMLAGFLGIAFGVAPLKARGIGPGLLLKFGMGLGLLATLLIVFGIGPSEPLWLALGLVFSVGNLAYALLQGDFAGRAGRPREHRAEPDGVRRRLLHPVGLRRHGGCLAGRRLPARAAYQMTFGGLLALQVASWLWFLRKN
jgi:MFS family permease